MEIDLEASRRTARLVRADSTKAARELASNTIYGLCAHVERLEAEARELAINGGKRAYPTLTLRQRDLWLFCCRYVKEHKIGPTFREMADAVGLCSKSGIARMMNRLEEAGYMSRQPYRTRRITIHVWPEDLQ